MQMIRLLVKKVRAGGASPPGMQAGRLRTCCSLDASHVPKGLFEKIAAKAEATRSAGRVPQEDSVFTLPSAAQRSAHTKWACQAIVPKMLLHTHARALYGSAAVIIHGAVWSKWNKDETSITRTRSHSSEAG